MKHARTTDSAAHQASTSGVLEVLAGIGERVADEPEALEQGFGTMARGLRESLGLRALTIEAGVRSGKVSAAAGETDGGSAVEFPILRGKLVVGRISAFPEGRMRLDEAQIGGLRVAAGLASLAISAADASEVAAERAAQGSVVQLASEALGRILDEGRLYRTVLVLALELLSSSAGVVFFDDGGEVSEGFAHREERLRSLKRAEPSGRHPWLGRIGDGHAIGVRLGGSGEAVIFLLREEKPYTVAEGVSLKLVARQLAWARERSRLHAALEQTSLEAIMALAAALESRDGTTGEHIRRTEVLAEQVAARLGLDRDDVQVARYTAILHDIGKIGIPDAILNKPGKLDEAEWEVIKRHPAMGASILSRIAGFERVAEAVLAHHERFDGQGYPVGLPGAGIPVESRIISVVDAYDAMTNDRPYRKAMSHEEAMIELEQNSGTQFDPGVVRVLKDMLEEKRRELEP